MAPGSISMTMRASGIDPVYLMENLWMEVTCFYKVVRYVVVIIIFKSVLTACFFTVYCHLATLILI